eukprot:TRINITY_DN18793_c0_g2_i1.p1 TRINITY_DN18793_c0_g2~~TRINITY_DN18793_c0_g2_i1.p1  ORF type:complete len:1174 (-),score=407.59 TRINITY_DN18793_c0_g2_i1:272-3793(-)
MVKSKFSSLDVRAMVNSIRPEAVGCKLTNIYDINSKVYILKLAKKNFKCFLLLESGIRFHLTDYSRDKSSVPSMYTMKLRKHIRTRRLTDIQQVGCDRVVDITFGRGETAFHLILELYVSGNLILTDHEYTILALLRSHHDPSNKVAVKSTYPLSSATGLLSCTLDEIEGTLEAILDKAAERQENQELQEIDMDDVQAQKEANQAKKGAGTSAFERRSKKRVKHDAMPLVQVLHKLAPFADPQLCSVCIGKAMAELSLPCENAFKVNVNMLAFDETVDVLRLATEKLLETLRSVSRPGDFGGGTLKPLSAEAAAEGDDVDEEDDDDDEETADKKPDDKEKTPMVTAADVLGGEYPLIPGWIMRKRVEIAGTEPYWANDEFSPLRPFDVEGRDPEAITAFESFHKCVDEFYTRIEENRSAEQKAMHAKSVYSKVEKIRADQNRRVEVLEAEQATAERQAMLIEANVDLVDRALAMINVMVASQIDWGEMWREVKRQQRLGHPIAQHIHSLDLARNEFNFLLATEEDEDCPMTVVPLNLSLSSHANVAKLHSLRKETREKTSRTLCQAEAAVKAAEKKAQQDLQKFQLKQTIRRVRQTWWFEKFIWFISSENYLVLAARDNQQAEQLFCRHLTAQDVFVQADVTGARSCFIKNPSGGEVPPATLREAGTMALCHSAAWDKRIVISAWWVPFDQVTRGKPPSEPDYMVVDNFYVRGRRHFMPPLHLEMGITLLFHVTGDAIAKHAGERRSRYLEAMGRLEGAEADAPPVEEEEEEEVEIEDDANEDGEAEAALPAGQTAKDEEEEEQVEIEDDVEAEDDEDEQGGAERSKGPPPSSGDKAAGRERVSKADRRRQKKGGPAGDEEAETAEFSPPPREAPASKAKENVAPGAKATPKPLPRGQKAKAKKMKKYADQDDEERELRLALLGSKATKRDMIGSTSAVKDMFVAPSPTATASSRQRADTEGDAEEGDDSVTAEATPSQAAQSPAAAASAAAAVAGGDAGQAAPQWKPKRPPPHAPDAKELTVGCESEAGTSELRPDQLDVLTGQPAADDEVLYVVPMVAPYCALGGPYMLRGKLTPGPGKKGQVARQCLKMFETQLDKAAWKQLLQAVPENETAANMCGSCKLSMPGMQKLQQAIKREKIKEVKKAKEDDGSAFKQKQGGAAKSNASKQKGK